MGLTLSNVRNAQPQASCHVDATKLDTESTKVSQEIEYWEKTYQQRFARRVIIPSFRDDSDRNPWFTFDPLWGLVNKPVVLKLSPEDVKNRIKYAYRVEDCSPRYVGPTPEPLSAELKARIRQELIHSFNSTMEAYIRQHVRSRWLAVWNRKTGIDTPVVVPYLNHGDGFPPKLFRKQFLGIDILSKITAVYFEPGFMRCIAGHCWNDDEDDKPDSHYGNGCAYIARAMLAAWREVHHYNGELANNQQYRWLANAVALEGRPGPRGALEDAIRTHKVICEELETRQNNQVCSEDPYTWAEHGFEMGPIYRAVIIVLDRQLELKRGKDEAELSDILFERCSALLVRTGDEGHLSAPVDLSTLTAAGLTLPLSRSEAGLSDPVGMQQVVRVRLRKAVRFIMDLERREINASPRLTARKNVLDADMLREAGSWADDVMAHAESNGRIDLDVDTWEAVRLARAHLDGDRCGLEGKPFQDCPPNVRYW
ncbi:hypothetical protein KVR01_013416 [Diaporthe batatas]|uniref:uncharacterized protein n=1 Tax=Diaporthe batatas TaxID=748121 RepID=UPI001D050CD1|nr:uncharacterized protein KVR01_013416 [Diaporthe batatas]KAG8156811.1 hypothetical protein KVR01_013416 [Diaporthe batatas]